MNLGILARVGGSLRGIVTHLKANRITDSEKRELEFDKDRRFEQLLKALNSIVVGGPGEPTKKSSRVMDLMKWVAKTFGLGFAGFKAFFGKFLKFMKLGKIWTLFKVAGLILSRLFWPLTIGAAMLWAIPKVIDAWPGIMAMIKNAVSGVWSGIKSFLGIHEEDDDGVASAMEGAQGPDPYYWDKQLNQWVIKDTVIPGVPQAREDVIKKLVPFVLSDNFEPDFLPAIINQYMSQSVASTPMTPLIGNNGSLSTPGAAEMASTPMTPLIGNNGFLSTPGAAEMARDAGLDPNLVALIAEQEGFESDAYVDPAGVMTIGYGHTGSDVQEGMSMSRQAAAKQLVGDVSKAKTRATGQMDAAFGTGTFANMSPKLQSVATDVAFNVGNVTTMPKLMTALASGDMAAVKKEHKRHYTTPQGIRMPLTSRNDAVSRMLDAPTTTSAGQQMAMQTTPASTVPGEDPPEVIVMPTETHNSHTVPVVSKSSSKKVVNQQAFYSDPFYAHLGIA